LSRRYVQVVALVLNDQLRKPEAPRYCGVVRRDFQGGRKHD